MSNFVERLVARGAGRPLDTSASLLTPRPTARFEPSGALGDAGDPVAEDLDISVSKSTGAARATDSPQAARGADEVAAPAADDRDRSTPPSRSRSETGKSLDSPAHQNEISSALERDGPDIFAEAASGVEPPINSSQSGAAAPQAYREPHRAGRGDEFDHEPPPPANSGIARMEPAIAASLRDGTAPPSRSWAAEERLEPGISSEISPGISPGISIGRIDVQFLPREAPSGALNAQPQRTRGFDRYARARRGHR